jgi:3-oxoacyl-[acyl-carrier-protein] synthase-3
MAASDLSVRAAERALAHANLKPDDIDAFIVATVTPDYIFPATASLVASRFGLVGKAAFDIEIACSGFIYALATGASMIRAGVFNRVVVIGAEKLSSITNYQDRSTAILFGDGAGAVILERSATNSFLSCELGTDGAQPELLYIPAGGTREPLTPERLGASRNFMQMQGREIFRVAVTRIQECTNVALARANLQVDDIAHMIPHQANKRIIVAAARQLGIPLERVVINIERYGNTSAASIPIALAEAVESGCIHDGEPVLFVGFGGGLSWGAVVWKW